MSYKVTEYKLNKKKQMIYLIIIILIITPLVINAIGGIIEANKIIAKSKNLNIQLSDMNAEEMIRYFALSGANEQKENSILLLGMSMIPVLVALHLLFFKNMGITIDNDGIRIYSIYQKEPSSFYRWENIKSIQIGYIYAARFTQYGIRIRYVESIDSLENFSEAITIKKFENYEGLVSKIEEMGQLKNVEVFNMNED
ncbi:hypothetical protein [Serpentinicella alkaliphila]|uniref:PH (Pleckstrin Homology) domain-containing protein n=1 Tax=Serpentinicella alkaliphila TaxID=1734049 RepID=A0A4R2TS52_9FIRM|nr:hypothetical protein [Serpentinicella alkaliphila]QUH24414.1 hypothetical protein HZR23_00445 [Serpentinicella alkaliphila]TCQ04195.1 hypothetical protein EDD79_100778 [Serpentinicella alkaliphila]